MFKTYKFECQYLITNQTTVLMKMLKLLTLSVASTDSKLFKNQSFSETVRIGL